ncbi:MAG: chorismate synthase [Candidatus Acididesulfobacter guangdongensis]|uniref:Chorismate synthase n=1 Tax=Acididesulfobacter guangdongensis TaxID=2597225 RepID=A0A519BFE3_ACIG2|nr:MAG: chorismate synthase [Candidatus Acididesulfobacter guangdongensis]
MLRLMTAGESHGKGLVTIIDNFPSGVKIDENFINEKLSLRQSGYGRGARQKIETDRIEFISGVRGGFTTGSPISFFIKNRDYENWKDRMDICKPVPEDIKIHIPRPGHADFAGSIKYNLDDIRNVLERSSARETASRVAAGAICELLLMEFDIRFSSAVLSIGGIGCTDASLDKKDNTNRADCRKSCTDDNNDAEKSKVEGRAIMDVDEDAAELSIDLFDDEILLNIRNSDLRMPFPEQEQKVRKLIDGLKKEGDTTGGIIMVQAKNVPIGLGSFTQWDEKLDAHIAMSMMSIQAIKSVEIGAGTKAGYMLGSDFQDSIYCSSRTGIKKCSDEGTIRKKYYRKTDNAGGIEGGMSNGEIISVECAMKPIPTLMKPYLDTVNLTTCEQEKAFLERSDVCAVPAASIVCESALAFTICLFFLKKFGGDSVEEIKRNYEGYTGQIFKEK